MASVASRTRSKQEQLYRKIHEEIKRKNLGSSFGGFRDRKRNNASCNYSVQSTSRMQSKEGKGKRKIITVISDSESESEYDASRDDMIEVEEIKPSVSDKGRTEHAKTKREYTVRKRKRNVPEDSDQSTSEITVSESVSSQEDADSRRIVFPEKFTFGVEESPPVEKSEEEKELDEIWDDMNLYLSSIDDPLDRNIDSEIEAEATGKGNCCNGEKHVFVVDEEIGLKCKICSFVELEIKYYTPPFCKNPYGHSGKRGFYSNQVHPNLDLDSDSHKESESNSGIQGTIWDIIPGIEKDLHTHQREGFQFLWKNIGGGTNLKELKQLSSEPDETGGCIISHAPGTGKTRLAIVFLQTYMELYPECRPVVIAPCSMLNSWEDEFKKWKVKFPFHNLKKSSGKRSDMLLSWKRDKSVLGVSYRLFEELVSEDKKGRNKSENETVRRILLQVPGILVLDEGHNPRNDSSLILQALCRIRTQKRIILSGTPFQNNFNELFNTLCLARPRFPYLVLNKDPRNRRIYHHQTVDKARREWKRITDPICEEIRNPILKAECLKNVRDMISPFVQVYEGNILQETLPGLVETVIELRPDKLQKRFLDRIKANTDLVGLNLEVGVSRVSVHPCLMRKELVQEGESGELKKLRLNPEAGVKTNFVFQLIKQSVALKEKVLVFSQYRGPLNLIKEQLVSPLKWTVEREILEINGTVGPDERRLRIKCFNDQRSEAKVMLATTRTCSEGINFVGASRVVLVDVVWNPQVERQAISRAYRLGQTRVVYVYRLIACGTMEEEKLRRQSEKGRVSDLVFCSSERAQKCGSGERKDRILEAMVESDKLKGVVERFSFC